MALAVTARWVAKAGHEAEVLHAIRQLIHPSRGEPGCRFYQPAQDPRDPRVFLIYEIYDDEAAYDSHAESAHFRRWAIGHAIPLLEERARAFYVTVGEPRSDA